MNSKALLLAAGITALAAVSAKAAQYSVVTEVDGKPTQWITGTDTPASALFGDPSTAAVQLGFAPVPSVAASTRTSEPVVVIAAGAPVYQDSYAQGQMIYGFQLSGAPDSTLELRFDGAFRLTTAPAAAGTNLIYDSTGSYNISNRAYVQLNLWTDHAASASSAGGTWDLSNLLYGDYLPWGQTDFSTDLTAGSSLSSSANTALHQVSLSYLPEFSGSFQGSLLVTLDHSGFASGLVSMRATTEQNASAFIDPYLSIDPAYLQLHPEASLSFEPGVGNAAPVPEPASAVLCVGGLGALVLHRRRRQGRAEAGPKQIR